MEEEREENECTQNPFLFPFPLKKTQKQSEEVDTR